MGHPMPADIVTLHESNFRQVPQTLRTIADAIEKGEYGDVRQCALVVMAGRPEVFAMGADSDPASAALLLHSGFLKISMAVMEGT